MKRPRFLSGGSASLQAAEESLYENSILPGHPGFDSWPGTPAGYPGRVSLCGGVVCFHPGHGDVGLWGRPLQTVRCRLCTGAGGSSTQEKEPPVFLGLSSGFVSRGRVPPGISHSHGAPFLLLPGL